MQSSNIDALTEEQIVLQSDTISYDKAYKANNSPLLDIFQLSDIIALVLTEILKETNKSTDNFTSAFHSKRVPSISVKDYLTRIAKCAKCSPECLILALIYLDRLTERNKRFIIKSLNIHRYWFLSLEPLFKKILHRLLMTSVMLAAKFFDDQFYNNEYYARVGGMSNQEINALEIEFLNLINFNLHVNPVVFFKYRQRLVIQAKTVFASAGTSTGAKK